MSEQVVDRQLRRRYQHFLKSELEAAARYAAIAGVEREPARADAFRKLAQAEMRHAARWANYLGWDPDALRPRRGLGLLVMKLVARLAGTRRVIPLLLRGEEGDIRAYSREPRARDIVAEERSHGQTLRSLGRSGTDSSGEGVLGEGRHAAWGRGSLRAAVLGVNDGLVSNFSLVMGVAGGTGDGALVLLAGVAGLLAGAFSMAAGEYVSVRSQRDFYEAQIELESMELAQWPEEEEWELTLLYEGKGLSRDRAREVARSILANPDTALDTMVKEELGLSPSDLGRPVVASASSFTAFVAGAAVPIAPYVFGAGTFALAWSAGLSAGALATVGGTLAFLSNKSVAWGAGRMLLLGGVAAGATFSIGRIVGVTIS